MSIKWERVPTEGARARWEAGKLYTYANPRNPAQDNPRRNQKTMRWICVEATATRARYISLGTQLTELRGLGVVEFMSSSSQPLNGHWWVRDLYKREKLQAVKALTRGTSYAD